MKLECLVDSSGLVKGQIYDGEVSGGVSSTIVYLVYDYINHCWKRYPDYYFKPVVDNYDRDVFTGKGFI